jgi:hypothetical protein
MSIAIQKKPDLKLVGSQIDLLKVISKSKKYRDAILHKADKELVAAICECVHNIIKGNLPIKRKDREQLLKFRKILHKLLQKRNFKQKKKILIQHGAFLNVLVPLVVTGLSSLLSSLISE